MSKKEIKSEQKDTKSKEPEAGVDGKETKAAAKTYVSHLVLFGSHHHIDRMCGFYSSTIPTKTAPSATVKPKRGQSNLFASWGNAPGKSVEPASESNLVICFTASFFCPAFANP